MLSWSLGVAIGRFDIRVATGARHVTAQSDPFDCIPSLSPGMLPTDSPVFTASTGILVDDVGHTSDIVASVTAVFESIGVAAPDPQLLRRYFAREFFPVHLKAYSKNRRKAPIYWQIGTPSGGYSIWIYTHAINKDTLFRLQTDLVTPKLAHEKRQLDQMRLDAGDNPNRTRRTAIASLVGLVDELQGFLNELSLVAPLWNPHPDDGIIINFAPLWRAVPQHRSWQRELASTWHTLCHGGHDWTHLSMHLWPERVVPKCAVDRSLAIAHGLGDVFWEVGADGKWKPRPIPTRPFDELINERSSVSVKAALKGLIEASTPAGTKARAKAKAKAKARRSSS